MKKVVFLFLLPAILFSCKTEPTNPVIGKWTLTLPEYKLNNIEKAFAANMREIDSLQSVPDYVTEQYGIRDLDSFKVLAKKDLQTQYDMQMERFKSIVYNFTKDGFMLFVNTKQNKSDTVYKYIFSENNLTVVPFKKNKNSEGAFGDSVKLQLLPSAKDSLVLCYNQNNISDTFYYIHQKG